MSSRCFKTWLCGVLSLAVSVVVGAFAGVLYQQHFMFGRIVFGVSLGIGVISLIALLYFLSRREVGRIKLITLLYLTDMLLLAASVIGLSILDAHTALHSALFGVDVGLSALMLFGVYGAAFASRRRREE